MSTSRLQYFSFDPYGNVRPAAEAFDEDRGDIKRRLVVENAISGELIFAES